jgi:tetratricopeptide (TPR) repeat protein
MDAGVPLLSCKCGWVDPTRALNAIDQIEKKTILSMVVGVALMMALFLHFATWGSYSFAVPFVKLQDMTGMLSKQGYIDYAKSCESLRKWACAKQAYTNLYKKHGEVYGIEKLARFQVRLGEMDEAMQTFDIYFRKGGKSGDAAYEYARLLDQRGMENDAIKFYDQSIEARPKVLAIQATAGIIRILTKQGRVTEVRERILAFQGSAENAKGFFVTELVKAETVLRRNAINRAKKVGGRMPASS